MIDRKDPLNLHSFIFLELLKKTEITDEFIEQALLNNDRIIGDCVYADTNSVKREELTMNNFKVGEYIVYANGDSYEIGKIKSLREDGAFVYYHEGDTASKTPFECMHKLANDYCIKKTTLGGDKC